MNKEKLPLEEMSIDALFNGVNKATYEVPVYQRNYAWGKDEISTLIQDIYDAYANNNGGYYYIGTLVSFNKGDGVYEVIDGQQRLTTIRLTLGALDIQPSNRLTYRARKKADKTLKAIPNFNLEEMDNGIVNGYRFAKSAIDEIVLQDDRDGFKSYFLNKVKIIHYHVPKDIDLNHYFEIMNSRGEQLEKHEIIKARMLSKLGDDGVVFSKIWESCSKMSEYIQQSFPNERNNIFGSWCSNFYPNDYNDLLEKMVIEAGEEKKEEKKSISQFLKEDELLHKMKTEKERADTFQPIIDFPNFLLIVLKITRLLDETNFEPTSFNLDDKELINEFDKVNMDENFVKKFGYNLLRAKYYLDNYIVHHANEEDSIENNPWALQKWQRESSNSYKYYPKNLFDFDDGSQKKAVHLLSMFEVSFTARQRKNYLFYCLFYLFKNDIQKPQITILKNYLKFVEGLAKKYFYGIYLEKAMLNEINTPLPRSFDSVMIVGNTVSVAMENTPKKSIAIEKFNAVYGDGTEKSVGVPLFVFNYLDYKIWVRYADELRGEKSKKGSRERQEFYDKLGCSDFELDIFKLFYFSRTRRSLEHYYPQAAATGENGALNEHEINCLGNYAMIGSEVNSSGSNNSPKVKLDHYLDTLSGKVRLVSVASLKFMIMMQICKDHARNEDRKLGQEWNFEDIQKHQEKMLNILCE